MKEKIKSIIQESIAVQKSALVTQISVIEKAGRLMISCLKKGGKIILFGNGGSAADCQHIAAELVGRFGKDRHALAAISLTTDTSVITSLANDYSYETVFARQVQAIGKSADVAFAISTSGNSENVLEAAKASRKIGSKIIVMTGSKGGRLAAIADVCVKVPSDVTARIQEAHILIGHILCQLIEDDISK